VHRVGASDSFFVARKEPVDLEPTVEHVQVEEEAMEKALDVIKNLLLENSQAMVLAACWITLDDIGTFSLFPEIVSVDTIFSTNKEKRPLLIGSGKENNRRTFSAFRCFLPYEQRWVFKFAFGRVIPSLLGEKNVRTGQQVNTDGDTEIYFPLDNLKSHPNSPWGKCQNCFCTYHLISKNLSEKRDEKMTTESIFLRGFEKEELLKSFPMNHNSSNSSSCTTINIVSFILDLLLQTLEVFLTSTFVAKPLNS
jgi:hypothetical protein